MNKVRVLLADSPWQYSDRRATRKDNKNKQTKFGLGAADRYKARDGFGGMSVRELVSLDEVLRPILAPDAYCFMWATCPMLKEAIEVLEGWGFRYVGIPFQWTKLTSKSGALFKGPGRYVPANMELVLMGVKGKPWHPTTGPKPEQEIRCPHPRDPETKKIIHSRKPTAVHERIEGWLTPYREGATMMELFATTLRPGWQCLGGAISGMDIREELESYGN